jgi:hypothetical protein
MLIQPSQFGITVRYKYGQPARRLLFLPVYTCDLKGSWVETSRAMHRNRAIRRARSGADSSHTRASDIYRPRGHQGAAITQERH